MSLWPGGRHSVAAALLYQIGIVATKLDTHQLVVFVERVWKSNSQGGDVIHVRGEAGRQRRP